MLNVHRLGHMYIQTVPRERLFPKVDFTSHNDVNTRLYRNGVKYNLYVHLLWRQ